MAHPEVFIDSDRASYTRRKAGSKSKKTYSLKGKRRTLLKLSLLKKPSFLIKQLPNKLVLDVLAWRRKEGRFYRRKAF